MEDSGWNDSYPPWLYEYWQRLKVVAFRVAARCRNDALAHVIFSDFVEDMRQAQTPCPQNPPAFAWRRMMWKAIDEVRRRRHELALDDRDLAGGANPENRVQLVFFVDAVKTVLEELETMFSLRRPDFRDRASQMIDVFSTRPYDYFDERHGLRVNEFAAALGWTPNAFQQFRKRIDVVLETTPIRDPVTGESQTVDFNDIFRWIYFAHRADETLGER